MGMQVQLNVLILSKKAKLCLMNWHGPSIFGSFITLNSKYSDIVIGGCSGVNPVSRSAYMHEVLRGQET